MGPPSLPSCTLNPSESSQQKRGEGNPTTHSSPSELSGKKMEASSFKKLVGHMGEKGESPEGGPSPCEPGAKVAIRPSKKGKPVVEDIRVVIQSLERLETELDAKESQMIEADTRANTAEAEVEVLRKKIAELEASKIAWEGEKVDLLEKEYVRGWNEALEQIANKVQHLKKVEPNVDGEGPINGDTVRNDEGAPLINLDQGGDQGKQLEDDDIQIFVKTWSGKTRILNVRRHANVLEAKIQIFRKLGVPLHHYYLKFSGKLLKDDRDLGSYGIGKESTLYMMLHTSYFCEDGTLGKDV